MAIDSRDEQEHSSASYMNRIIEAIRTMQSLSAELAKKA